MPSSAEWARSKTHTSAASSRRERCRSETPITEEQKCNKYERRTEPRIDRLRPGFQTLMKRRRLDHRYSQTEVAPSESEEEDAASNIEEADQHPVLSDPEEAEPHSALSDPEDPIEVRSSSHSTCDEQSSSSYESIDHVDDFEWNQWKQRFSGNACQKTPSDDAETAGTSLSSVSSSFF